MRNYKTLPILGLCAYLCAFQKVDLNEATSEQIALLPSVGPKLAKEIINYRKKNKGFKSNEELRSLSGMTPKKFENIAPFVVITTPKRVKAVFIKENLHTLAKKAVIPLADLEIAAFRSMGLQRKALETLRENAKKSAWLPRLGLAFDIDRDVDTAEKGARLKPDAIEKRGLDMGFAIRATFDLPEIIFNRAELEIANLELKHLAKREEVQEKIHSLYFNYLALAESGQTPQGDAQIKIIEASLDKLTLSLDSLCDGAFSKYQLEKEGL